MQKKCKRCNQSKASSEFGKHPNSIDRLQGWCKKCMSDVARERNNKRYNKSTDTPELKAAQKNNQSPIPNLGHFVAISLDAYEVAVSAARDISKTKAVIERLTTERDEALAKLISESGERNIFEQRCGDRADECEKLRLARDEIQGRLNEQIQVNERAANIYKAQIARLEEQLKASEREADSWREKMEATHRREIDNAKQQAVAPLLKALGLKFNDDLKTAKDRIKELVVLENEWSNVVAALKKVV